MGLLDEYLEEEAYRERDLKVNVLMDDGKWMFPVKMQIINKEIKEVRRDIKNEQVGKYRCLNESVF